jgi:aspartokinase/homoserine dehydrogenase 1
MVVSYWVNWHELLIILSFGELLSSTFIAAALKQKIPNSDYKDSRDLIKQTIILVRPVNFFEVTNG